VKSLFLEISSKTLMDHSKTGISYAVYKMKEIKLTTPVPNTLGWGRGKVERRTALSSDQGSYML